VKTDDIGGTRAKQSRVVQPTMGPTPPILVWALVAHSRASCPQVASHVKIFMPEKSSVNLSSRRSLKHENTQNRCFLLYKVTTKIRGISGKSPLINTKHD
jgi:hypothetical protein